MNAWLCNIVCCVYSIDATHTPGLARMCNDEIKKPNAVMKKLIVSGDIHLALFALRDIEPGHQIVYDYGENDGTMFWRQVSGCVVFFILFLNVVILYMWLLITNCVI